jgi:hypothetical protein
MPTMKPRIAVTLDRRVFETIDRLAQLQGSSRGRVLADLVGAVHEPLMRTVALLDAAAGAPQEVRNGLAAAISSVEAQLVGASGGGLAQLDWLRGKLSEKPVSRARARPSAPAPRRLRREANPRTCNTGVRSRKKGRSK